MEATLRPSPSNDKVAMSPYEGIWILVPPSVRDCFHAEHYRAIARLVCRSVVTVFNFSIDSFARTTWTVTDIH